MAGRDMAGSIRYYLSNWCIDETQPHCGTTYPIVIGTWEDNVIHILRRLDSFTEQLQAIETRLCKLESVPSLAVTVLDNTVSGVD